MTTAQRTHPIGARLGAAAGCALVVVLLGVGVTASWGPQLRLDADVSRALYAGDGRSALVQTLLDVATAPGYSVARFLVFLPVVVWLVRARRWVPAAWVTVSVVGVGLLNSGVKELVGRPRPQFADGGAQLSSLSFPSGHASGVACLVTTALVLAWPHLSGAARRWWTLAGVALALLVGTSRMWLGVHYLSDVVAGWALGVGWTLLVVVVVQGVRWTRA
ncbi:phosphatase PAP2 family protein [Klenkia sp. PcliD-1-E]|uniref:phosphatase PAP2 family protein n=1 Tax=Klenkia sp. PcliD-1-E TaxID=2954492 RepID=UPI002096ADCB|nr:phosphatase PAP2 family protein [Klenkia sp. PcliD-1-E]MCO7220937.1 phosphatase PAP2 family protein [Klenkia sp. PcliD-1-E]